MTDFTIRDEGSIFLVLPVTEEAQTWVNENIPDDGMTYGGAVVVEHRYIEPIVCGIIADGLTVA